MLRQDIIDKIGREYYSYTTGSEVGEFFYKKELESIGISFDGVKCRNTFSNKESYYKDLDIRFVNNEKKLSVCVETKTDSKKTKKDLERALEQLNAYMQYEKVLSGNKVIGILANTTNAEVLVYEDSVLDVNKLELESIVSMGELVKLLFPTNKNSKTDVINATYRLNETLHGFGIEAKIRGQFVGTCLLALKKELIFEVYDDKGNRIVLSTDAVLTEIKRKLEMLLTGNEDEAVKKQKVDLLVKNTLGNENVKKLSDEHLNEILKHIQIKILPYIQDDTTAGQDILNLFFTMFNKYVDKDDKNQAFTPDHITDFMCKLTGVNKDSRVLDPCCGSGAFLVRAMVSARNSCTKLDNREKWIENINRKQIYGIECSEKPYGLATTNMLIHGDGYTNVIKANCFDKKDWIINTVNPSIILMNPPYNAQRVGFPTEIIDYVECKEKKGKKIETKVLKTYSIGAWSSQNGKPPKEDPTKGLCFVDYISDCLRDTHKTGQKLAVLLPLQCAIGSSGLILRTKQNLLKYNTLEAVFTLPPEMFHPGASANACCMLFTMGEPHYEEVRDSDGCLVQKPRKKTFFGYYKDDGFVKKKQIGRVEVVGDNNESVWETEIEPKWLKLYNNREVELGLSVLESVCAEDEWLCEAYMQTDYSKLTDADFQTTLNDYLSYLVKEGSVYEQ